MNLKEFRKTAFEAVRNNEGKFAEKQNKDKIIREALKEFCKVEEEGFNPRNLREYKGAIFTVIEELIDEVLPINVENKMGLFAEVKQYARNESVIFKIKTTNASKRRALGAIKNGARGGIYESRRLDGTSMAVDTAIVTVGYQITLEELLSGDRTISEMMDIITAGMEENIYVDVIKALRSLKTNSNANALVENGASIDKDLLDTMIRNVGAYGAPVLIGFPALLNKFSNTITIGDSFHYVDSDGEEIKNTGRVAMYKGHTLVELPNYLVGGYNNWLFKEGDLFVISSQNNKPVKVALQGEGYILETQHPTGSIEYNFHKLLGVGIMTGEGIGVYSDSEINVVGKF